MRVSFLIGFLLIVMASAAACGEGEMISSEPDPTATRERDESPQESSSPADNVEPTETPTPVSSQLDMGAVGIYMSATIDSDSSLFRDANTGPILLESSTNGVVLLNADTGAASLVTTSSSPSYASNRLVPVTVGEKLFVVTEFSSGNVYYDEYSPQSGEVVGALGRRLPHNTDQYAIGESMAYYVREIERFGQPTQRRFVEYDLQSGVQNELGGFTAPGGGFLVVSDDTPYWVTIPFDDDSLIEVYALVGAPQVLAQGQINGFDQYASWSYQNPVVSGGSVYWLAMIDRGASADVEIWRYDLSDTSGLFEEVAAFQIELAGVSALPLFDVDGNYFAASVEYEGGRRVMLFDLESQTTELFDVDVRPYELQVMYQGG